MNYYQGYYYPQAAQYSYQPESYWESEDNQTEQAAQPWFWPRYRYWGGPWFGPGFGVPVFVPGPFFPFI